MKLGKKREGIHDTSFMAKPAREIKNSSLTYIDADIYSRFSKLCDFLTHITHIQIFTLNGHFSLKEC